MNKLVIIVLMFTFIYSQCLGDINTDYDVDIQDIVQLVNIILS